MAKKNNLKTDELKNEDLVSEEVTEEKECESCKELRKLHETSTATIIEMQERIDKLQADLATATNTALQNESPEKMSSVDIPDGIRADLVNFLCKGYTKNQVLVLMQKRHGIDVAILKKFMCM